MRKVFKLISLSTIVSTSALQVSACTDNSKYNSFLSDVQNTIDKNSAFFGFLGTADDDTCSSLQDTFDFLNQKDPNSSTHGTRWQTWLDDKKNELKGADVSTIALKYYQGPYHQNKPSDPISSFWNDKSISWQKNIFNWIYARTDISKYPNFKTPIGVPAVEKITTKKDGDNKDMFEKLPIVFIISKGQLITAGQSWLAASASPADKISAVEEFVLANLLLITS